jgi:hypothetical protein
MCTSNGECSTVASGAHPQQFSGGSGEAQVEAPGQGVEQHDGFMLRISIGASGGESTLTAMKGAGVEPAEVVYSGFGSAFALDIGGRISNNLVLHGRFGYSAIEAPDTTQDGEDLGSIEVWHVGAIFLGPAVGYYFMPINVYVTGAIGFAGIVVSEDGNDTPLTVSSGFGLNVDVGKEWWVSDNWGLGAVARLAYSTGGDKDNEYDVSSYALALLFSATFQ